MGHRNPQGIAFQPGTGLPFTSEHAHYTDRTTGAHSHATVNLLKPGLNFSWPNGAGPGFTPPAWQSLDNPYVATSGNTFVSGPQWGAWDGDLFLAALRWVIARSRGAFRTIVSSDGQINIKTNTATYHNQSYVHPQSYNSGWVPVNRDLPNGTKVCSTFNATNGPLGTACVTIHP